MPTKASNQPDRSPCIAILILIDLIYNINLSYWLKGMIPILEGIAERLVAEMGGFADRGDMLELKETFGKYRVVVVVLLVNFAHF